MTEAAGYGEPRIYHQINLTILKTLPLWESIIVLHSYGDLGLILMLLYKPYVLVYTQSGLQIGDDSGCEQHVQRVYFV